jgi:ribosome-binding protein aMBF1 (putative translation factor)
MSKTVKSPRKVKGVGSYLSNVVSNVAESVKNTGKSVFSPNSKKTQIIRSQYAAKKGSSSSKKVVKRKLRSLYAKKVRKTRSDKGVKRGPRKTM